MCQSLSKWFFFKKKKGEKKRNLGVINCSMLGEVTLFLNFEFHLR